MPEVKIDFKAQLEQLTQQMRQAADAARAIGGDFGKMDAAIEGLEKATGSLANQVKKLFAQQSELQKGMKGTDGEIGKITKGTDEYLGAIRRAMANQIKMEGSVDRLSRAWAVMGSTGRLVTDVQGLSSDALAKLDNVSKVYSRTLKDTGDNQSYLLNQWKRSLSPAEKHARMLAETVSFATDAERQTAAYQATVGKLALKLEEATEREKANTAAGAKRTMTLREMFHEQTNVLATATLLTGATEAQTKALKEQARAYDRSSKKLDAISKAMTAFHLPGAGLFAQLRNITESLRTMHDVGSGAEARLLRIGLAAGALAGAVVAPAIGLAALTASIAAVALKADEWNHELRKVGLALDEQGTERINRSAAALDALGTVTRAAGVAFADELAKPITDAATRLVALGLAGIDAWRNLAQGEPLLARLEQWFARRIVEAIQAPVRPLVYLLEGMSKLAAMAGAAGLAGQVDELVGAFQRVKEAQAEWLSKGLQATAEKGLKPLIAVSDDYMARATEIIGKQMALNAVTRDGKQAKEVAAKATEKQKDALQKLSAELDRVITSGMTPYAREAAEVATQQRVLDEALLAGLVDLQQYTAQTERLTAELAKLQSETIFGKGGLISQVMGDAKDLEVVSVFDTVGAGLQTVRDIAGGLGSQISGMIAQWSADSMSSWQASSARVQSLQEQIDASTDASETARLESRLKAARAMAASDAKNAIRAFKIQKVSSLASIGMNTAEGVMKAISLFGPPPSPPGIAGIAAAIAAGALQAASVIKQKPPTIPVTDAYIPPSMGRQLIATTPGDTVTVRRAGALTSPDRGPDREMLNELRAGRAATERQTSVLEALRLELLTQRHFSSVGVARAF